MIQIAIFDGHYRDLDDGGQFPYGERLKRALDLTVANPIIQRVGVEVVIKAARDKGWSEKFLSPHAKDALGIFIQQ